MGSPEYEVGRGFYEIQHQVTLTEDFYIGVFEITQKQYSLIYGSNPSSYKGDTRPVENVSYDTIRGTGSTAGAGWPAYGHAVDEDSFLGKLRAKTGQTFDLPTEAQWEYACRAGTTTALNTGKNLTSEKQDSAVNEAGRYGYNQNDGKGGYSEHTRVGSYLPNAWGLYDMHGNVWEWCLDWDTSDFGSSAVTDPVGPYSGVGRVIRGGSWHGDAQDCRSANRTYGYRSIDESINGFRVVLLLNVEPDYLVVDLNTGAITTSSTGPDPSDDTCRTTELWLRRIPKGTFTMGSPEGEVGRESRDSKETQHQVTITEDFYIGVFEITQKQYSLIQGSNPSEYKGDTRPVDYVSYNTIRGTGSTAGAGWPTYGHAVDSGSFLGKLRAKTGQTFDLPTEAQWEYACRAGTTTALNTGKNLTSEDRDSAMDEAGRYLSNQKDGRGGYSEHTKVGSYLPNAWGLYDMHGNVEEWCLDWHEYELGSSAVTDPKGPNTVSDRVLRGGSWGEYALTCRSADRSYCDPSGSNYGGHGFRVVLLLTADAEEPEPTPEPDFTSDYLVVNLNTGAVTSSSTGPDLSDDTCRTTELWLRRIPKGTFTMGSPEGEVGREPGSSKETQHQVTLTEDFYIGVFEITQKQYSLIQGSNPSSYKGDTRPVEYVSYNDIRGTGSTAGAGWPTYGHAVDSGSFLGKLRAKTGKTFDLPTEAQWEYACRAGTTTALNTGKNLTSTDKDSAMAEAGRNDYNQNDGKGGYSEHTKVGSYLPNAWGLYDMHGNVVEWCLDWWKEDLGSSAVTDPKGSNSGIWRVIRGGSWGSSAQLCRSAFRAVNAPSTYSNSFGFRVVLLP